MKANSEAGHMVVRNRMQARPDYRDVRSSHCAIIGCKHTKKQKRACGAAHKELKYET
jgi:hypothetical protein